MLFSSRNQPAGHFFLKSPITTSKIKWSAPKIHKTFGQLTDSDLSVRFLLTPTRKVRTVVCTDGRTVTS